ncbi:alpha-amylase family glycosyl hydrolase [Catenuloplanes indicus]|uniref:Glycosidase n=1 Tax=Catenuloplanes indicus TaxID=137267 RepID=A0AAE3W6R3_9ACTN|nr:alpha-amylase family glycosyl hydrolase [Catenuloplanes indicus]MDQ0370656.1 glycosidase [Catenuloplanes indicus]
MRSVSEIDVERLTGRAFHPSPVAWEDEVLYFLMVDRFSDGRERDWRDNDGVSVAFGETPRLRPENHGNALGTEAERAAWRDAGERFTGGTLRGLRGKLGYLRRLGITAVWVSPILKQVPGVESYHGYGTQDFLDVDPRFGTPDDLRDLVATAHAMGIRVILDVVLNHTGDVFDYAVPAPVWDGSTFPVAGFRDTDGKPVLPFGPLTDRDTGVWPAELQTLETFTREGRIQDWDRWPEYLRGDFQTLKDVALLRPDGSPSPALAALTRAYQFWLAFADLDGFRVDTVKHMDPAAARYFASAIHEFAASIGKENFYLIAEITGPRSFAFRTLQAVGMDAALGIADVQDHLEWLVKGRQNPVDYFGLFRDALQDGKDSHTWYRNRVVTGFDDHDQVRKGARKARFAATEHGDRLAVAALALNAATLGIPCVYYGTEQLFDGAGGDDRYIREAMFGGAFGPFRSRGRHAFDEDHPVYRGLARVLALRRRVPALRRGRQYLRPISGDGVSFGPPQIIGDGPMRAVVPWSRIFAGHEVLCAINTDPFAPRTAWVTVDRDLHPPGTELTCHFNTDQHLEGTVVRAEPRNGSAIPVTVPAGGFVAYW